VALPRLHQSIRNAWTKQSLGRDVPNLTPMAFQVIRPAAKNLRFSDKHLFRCARGIRNYDKEEGRRSAHNVR
jgi:hypothetical protein